MRAKSGGYLGHQYFVCLFWVSGSRELLVGILSKLIMVSIYIIKLNFNAKNYIFQLMLHLLS